VKADQDQKILLTYAVMYLDYLRYETPFVCLGIRWFFYPIISQ